MPPTHMPMALVWFAAFFFSAQAEEALAAEEIDPACARAVTHRPAPDVAYEEGVTADGGTVAPADLPPDTEAWRLPDEIGLEVQLDPSPWLPAEAAPPGARLEGEIGRAAIGRDGAVRWRAAGGDEDEGVEGTGEEAGSEEPEDGGCSRR